MDIQRKIATQIKKPLDVHVINLPQARARKDLFLAYNRPERIRFIFADGIDSTTLDFQKLKKRGLIKAGAKFRTPGCGLAHRNLWLKAVRTGKSMIICEDDAVLREDFYEQFHRCIKALPNDWQFLLLGYNFDTMLDMEIIPGVEYFSGRFSNTRLRSRELKQFKRTRLPVSVMPLLHAFGTPGYAVTPLGAKHLLDHVFPLRNQSVRITSTAQTFLASTIDGLMNGLYPEMSAYVCMPPLIATPNQKDPKAKIVSVE